MLLSTRTQASIIVEILYSRHAYANLADLTGEFRQYHDWLLANPVADFEQFLNEFSSLNESHLINCRMIAAIRKEPLDYDSIDQVLSTLPDLQWLWYGWIPRGQITLLVGDPSAGKSYFALDLARRIIADRPMPDKSRPHVAGPVLYIDAENRPMVLKQRIAPWADERQRFFYMLPAPHKMMINLDYQDDIDRLLDRVYRINPALVIVDSYGTITLKGENAKEDVQRVLSLLTQISRDYNCAILVIHHLRKKTQLQLALPGMETMSLSSVRGSGHIAAMATNVIGMSLASQDKNGQRILQVIKNNLGKYPEPLGVTFSAWEQDHDVAILTYGQAPKIERDASQLDECMDWLINILEEAGELSPAQIIDLAKYEEFSERTIYRARKELGDRIKNTHGRQHPENKWMLAAENNNQSEDSF